VFSICWVFFVLAWLALPLLYCFSAIWAWRRGGIRFGQPGDGGGSGGSGGSGVNLQRQEVYDENGSTADDNST
jgi:hypothetical protein